MNHPISPPRVALGEAAGTSFCPFGGPRKSTLVSKKLFGRPDVRGRQPGEQGQVAGQGRLVTPNAHWPPKILGPPQERLGVFLMSGPEQGGRTGD